MKYRVNIQQTDEGFSVSVPGLPGCWSQGQTEQEALENIKDAIENYGNMSGRESAKPLVRNLSFSFWLNHTKDIFFAIFTLQYKYFA